jgi:CoA:oxalate CoA-transferase
MLMGDMGAEIIKVEPLAGDETRVGPPYFYGENSAYFIPSTAIKERGPRPQVPGGTAGFSTTGQKADVVYDNYRPG